MNSLVLIQINQHFTSKSILMLPKSQQVSTKNISQYIFQLKSLNSIERNLQRTINQRFKSKIHFISLKQTNNFSGFEYAPLSEVAEEEIEDTFQKCTPSKSTNKQMRMHSTASKLGNELLDSPQSRNVKKSKPIAKETRAPLGRNRFGMKIHYYYPVTQRLRI